MSSTGKKVNLIEAALKVTGKLVDVVERLIKSNTPSKPKLNRYGPWLYCWSNRRLTGSEEEFAVLASDEDMVFEEVDRFKKNEDLVVDLHNYKVMFGEDTINYTPIVALEQLEIEMILPPLDLITFTTAKAWGLDPTTPIIIKVIFVVSTC